jgi:hypothetical protein
VEHSLDGYFDNLITVRTASGVDWFLDFILLLEFQSNVTFGKWPRSLCQVKSGMATTEFGSIARAIIKVLAAYSVSKKFLRVFKSSVSIKFLWSFKSSVYKVFQVFKSSVSTKFLKVSSQVCPLSSSEFQVKCVH